MYACVRTGCDDVTYVYDDVTYACVRTGSMQMDADTKSVPCKGTKYVQGKKFEFSIQKLSNLLSFAL